ncbi:MAG: Spy/CpxP family protein refolding chaperone [bacterium]
MSEVQMMRTGQILALLAVLVVLVTAPSTCGQTAQQQPEPTFPQQPRFGADPIRELNLTPQQREQIRTIRQQNQTERAAINERVRETNRALEAVLDSDNPDGAAVEERMREAAAAQAAAMRMRILTEVRIRRVLTPEQRNLLRALRQQANQLRRERPLNSPDERLKRREERRSLQNQRNGIGPFFPRRDAQRRARPIDQ